MAAAQTQPQQTHPFSVSHTSPCPLTFADTKGMLAQGNETYFFKQMLKHLN